MKTKICPNCGKEIQGKAILCKYCHSLLVDDDGNELPEERVNEDTIIFNKASQPPLPRKTAVADDYDDDYEDEYDDEYDDDDDDDDYDGGLSKTTKIYIMVAVITVGVIITALVCLLVGTKLFGNKEVTVKNTTTTTAATPAEPETPDASQTEQEPAVSSVPEQDDPNETSSTTSSSVTPEDPNTTTTTTTVSSDDTTTTTTTASSDGQDTPATTTLAQGEVEAQIANQVYTQRGSTVSSIQFRESDSAYYYYYAFTEDGKTLSIAVNYTTGEWKIVGG